MKKSMGLYVVAGAVLASLAACGGGGGGGSDQGAGNPPTPGATSVLAGGWAAADASARVFVLADGTAWVFTQSPTLAPLDMVVGRLDLDANGTSLTSTGMDAFDYETTSATGASATGSFVGSQMNFIITPDTGAAIPIAVNAVGASDYTPARGASLSEVEGVWTGAYRTTEAGAAVIGADGSFTTTATNESTSPPTQCTSTGTLKPRANENVFDVELKTASAGCVLSNTAAVGHAFVIGSGDSARLYLGVKTPEGSSGATFIGKPSAI